MLIRGPRPGEGPNRGWMFARRCLICRHDLRTQAHILCACPALNSTSAEPSAGSRRGRSVPWAKRSYTSFTSTNHSKNGANSGRDYGLRHTDTSSKELSLDAPYEPVDGSSQTSARGPPPGSPTSGHSIKKHWRTTALGRKLHGPTTPMTSPRTPPTPRLRGALATSTVWRRRFRAHPVRRQPGPQATGTTTPPRTQTKPLATGTPHLRTPRPPTTPRHHRRLGFPPGGVPRLNCPNRPRAQEDTY